MTKNWFANLEVYNLVIIVLLQFVVIKEVHISLIVLTGALYVATVLLYNIGATPTMQQYNKQKHTMHAEDVQVIMQQP